MGAGSQGVGLFLTAFPDYKQGGGWKVGLLGLEQVPICDSGAFKVRILAAIPWRKAHLAAF